MQSSSNNDRNRGWTLFNFTIENTGIVVVEAFGFWTTAIADAYLEALERNLTAARKKRGYALSLIDGRHSAVQPPEVIERLAAVETISVPCTGDRSAYIVPNSLVKLQAKRLIHTTRMEVFLSPDAARTWLLAAQQTPHSTAGV
jgi:hypothetical protein